MNDVVKWLGKIIYDAGRQKVLPENPINIGDIHEALSNINANTKQLWNIKPQKEKWFSYKLYNRLQK